MTCPACDNVLEDRIGLFDCPQCKSKLVRSAFEANPRERIQGPNLDPIKPRQLPGTISYPFEIISGRPMYRCVGCGNHFPVSHAPNRTRTYKGRSEIVSINGSSVVDWIKRESIYSIGTDGKPEVSTTAIPVVVTGPVCAQCVR